MLEEKLIIVTGGAGRIGSAFCRSILENNGKVVICDFSEEKGNSLEGQLSDPNVKFIKADITKVKSIKSLINQSVEYFQQPVSSAVHCAYPVSDGWGASFEDLLEENLAKDLFAQLGGAILFSQQMILHFLDSGQGNLINISSIQGIQAPKFEHYEGTNMSSPIEYSAIKSGVISMTKYLAKLYKKRNIRVNCISPGGILDGQPESFLKSYEESCNSKGMLDSQDLVGTLLFLLSDQSQFMTGQNIIIDDGWSL
tara:strand:- start:365 stop:1126 length:762 start_codon:yes stop_codon:yes gene_type:complete